MPVNFSKNIGFGTEPLLPSTKNTLFEVALIIIVCGLFGWFIILPKKASVNEKKESLAKITLQESQVSEKVTKLQRVLGTLKTDPQDVEYLNQAIPFEGNAIKLRLLVKSLADSVGVTVGNIGVGSKGGEVAAGNKALLADEFGAKRNLQTLSGTLYVVGSFNQLQTLLKKFENSGRIIDVGDISIEQGSEGKLTMNLTFKSYYFAP